MSSTRDAFDAATTTTREERDRTEAELAASLAQQFRKDPLGFDPRRLRSLSHSGLKAILADIADRDLSAATSSARSSDAFLPDEDHFAEGWSDMRRPEANSWVAGIGWGIALSLIVTGIGAIARGLIG
jgi:hypothetical protein